MRNSAFEDGAEIPIISRRNSLAIFLIISIILHAGLMGYLVHLARERAALAKPLEIMTVSLAALPAMRSAAMQPSHAAAVAPKAELKPLPLPGPLPPQPNEEKSRERRVEPDAEAQPAAASDTPSSGAVSPGASPEAHAPQAGVTDGQASQHAIINARDIYIALIDPLIKRGIVYPATAQRRGWEGRMILNFIVGPDGMVTQIQVARSSGYGMLDKAAVEHIRRIKFPPPPYPNLVLPVPVSFKLEEG